MWIIWNDDPGDNVEHIAEHGLLPDEVEYVLVNYESAGLSDSSGRPCVFGFTEDDRYIIVIYDQIDEDTIYPVTAYEVPEP
ncbi:MAG: hypothetical protein O3C40_07970 [Planctomycetota bacterium]|nr:hypothetical protein [Planctomycetota bacterium]